MANIKKIDASFLDTELINIANSIREKTSSSTNYNLSNMPTTISNISNSDFSLNDIAQHEIDGDVILNNSTTKITTHAFVRTKITSITGPEVTQINTRGFYQCEQLNSINFPNLTEVNHYGFLACTSLISANLPKVKSLGNLAFSGCKELTTVNLPEVTSIGTSCFENCSKLIELNLPKYTGSLGTYAIRNCSSLKKLLLPSFGANAGLQGYGLQGCTSLEILDYGKVNTALFNSLPVCPLHTIILRNTNRVVALFASTTLDNSTAFQQNGTGGDIYIPKSFYDHLGDGTTSDYKSATNWSVYDAYGTITWHSIEGSVWELND